MDNFQKPNLKTCCVTTDRFPGILLSWVELNPARSQAAKYHMDEGSRVKLA
jgi:hypothetical protein